MSIRQVLSPITPTSNIRTPTSMLAPATSSNRSNTLKSPVPLLAQEHDDATEKIQRRRSRVVQLQQSLDSPSSPNDRRKSLPLNGLTANQLAEHYTNCIKLSAENKINAKNAFGLHLIDFMTEQMKKKELGNLQVASTTLDASAKIYAGRVDAIHTETYKVLTGLGRGREEKGRDDDENQEMGGDGDGRIGSGDEETAAAAKQKHRKKSRKKIKEVNLKNITLKKMDREFEMDPLCHVTSSAFDEGGISGLLMNHLRCFDDKQHLVLKASTVIAPTTPRKGDRVHDVSISSILESLQATNLQDKEICPSFTNFTFTNWDSKSNTSIIPKESEHAFDINAEAEPIDDDADDGADDFDLPDNAMPDIDMEDHRDDDSVRGDDGDEITANAISIGDGKAAQLMESAMRDLTHGTTGTLLQVLAAQPSDYSYFNQSLLSAWAGPHHWRIKPLSKDPKLKAAADKSKSRMKKLKFQPEYDQDMDLTKYFKISKNTTVKKATLVKNSKKRKTLPKDIQFESDKLFSLKMKPNVYIKRAKTSDEDIDDKIDNYDYDNMADKDNYCPKTFDDDHDDDSHGGDFDFNFTAAGSEVDNTQNMQELTCHSQDVMETTTLAGDKLVAQPNRVNKIDIAYAKTAKRLDVKRLKTTMWTILKDLSSKSPSKEASGDGNAETEKTDEDKESMEMNTNDNAQASTSKEGVEEEEDTKKEMKKSCTFQGLLSALPEQVSDHMAKNLSVPIAFACLLHLANEKGLRITQTGDSLADLVIEQEYC